MPDVFEHKKSNRPHHKTETAHHEKVSATDSVAHLKKQRISFLTSYAELPEGVQFENQEEEEVIYLFLRRHPITNALWILITVVLLLLPLLIPTLFATIAGSLELFGLEIPTGYLVIVTFLYYLIVGGYALLNFMSWFYNISLVTNYEVVDIDYSAVTYKNIASTSHREIQDVEYIQRGFFQTFFNYGDVHVQTAGAHPNIEYLRVPFPGKVNDIIMDSKRRLVGHG